MGKPGGRTCARTLYAGGRLARKIAPKQRHVVHLQIPTQSKKEREAGDRPEKEAHRQGACERHLRLGEMEEQPAKQADAACETDSREGSNEAVFPARGRDEKGRVQQSAERENAHRKGNGFAEIEKQVSAPGLIPNCPSGTRRCRSPASIPPRTGL